MAQARRVHRSDLARIAAEVMAERGLGPYSVVELQALADHCTAQEDAARKEERRMRKSDAALLLGSHVVERGYIDFVLVD